MLRHICVAYDDPRSRRALELGIELARAASARLTITHVAPIQEWPLDAGGELLGLREDVRWRQNLAGLALRLEHEVDTGTRVLLGSVAAELLMHLHFEEPDLLLVGSRALTGTEALGPRLRYRLVARAPCPVMFVRSEPASTRRPLILAPPRPARAEDESLAVAAALADALDWPLVSWRPPRGRNPTDVDLVLAACDEYSPTLLVVNGEPWHGLRSRLRISRSAQLIDTAPCPVLVVSRAARQAPIVDSKRRRLPASMADKSSLEHDPKAAAQVPPAPGRLGLGPSLLWPLFAANATLLAAALLVLLLAPVSVSRDVVLTEALTLGVGLGVLLVLNLLLLRRALEPLRMLTAMMAAIDPRQPGRRLAPSRTRLAEIRALTDTFNAMLDRLEAERRESARMALAAQEDERKRIAQEIHDQVGQVLTAVTIQAQRAAQMGGSADPALFDQLARTALESLDEVRRIGRELRPEALDDLGLGNALIALCRRLAMQGGIRIVPKIEAGIPVLRSEVDLVIYRIAQEAITNALRHAAAVRVQMQLRCTETAVELIVSDDGSGLPVELADDTAGISGMRERATLVNGGLSLSSRRGEGTEVRLSVPLEEAVT